MIIFDNKTFRPKTPEETSLGVVEHFRDKLAKEPSAIEKSKSYIVDVRILLSTIEHLIEHRKKLRYSDYFSIFAELENKARLAWQEYDIMPYDEDAKVVDISAEGVTFEFSYQNWGTVVERVFIPLAWIDRITDDKTNAAIG